jgi:hypothetical protein
LNRVKHRVEMIYNDLYFQNSLLDYYLFSK